MDSQSRRPQAAGSAASATGRSAWLSSMPPRPGLPRELFSPVFAICRVGGWSAHCMEQLAAGRLIRPKARYAGAVGRRWVPASERST